MAARRAGDHRVPLTSRVCGGRTRLRPSRSAWRRRWQAHWRMGGQRRLCLTWLRPAFSGVGLLGASPTLLGAFGCTRAGERHRRLADNAGRRRRTWRGRRWSRRRSPALPDAFVLETYWTRCGTSFRRTLLRARRCRRFAFFVTAGRDTENRAADAVPGRRARGAGVAVGGEGDYQALGAPGGYLAGLGVGFWAGGAAHVRRRLSRVCGRRTRLRSFPRCMEDEPAGGVVCGVAAGRREVEGLGVVGTEELSTKGTKGHEVGRNGLAIGIEGVPEGQTPRSRPTAPDGAYTGGASPRPHARGRQARKRKGLE